MGIFALVSGDTVRNCIVADDLDDVVTAFPDNIVIEMTEALSPAYIDGRWDGTRFYPPQPGPDWTWSDEQDRWIEPLPDTVLVVIGDE